MTKPEALELLMLLSALESWLFSIGKTLPDYLYDRLAASVNVLRLEVLGGQGDEPYATTQITGEIGMDDSKLLELAGRAAGETFGKNNNPLDRDDLALRLAVRLGIDLSFEGDNLVFADGNCSEFLRDDYFAATRRAIVRAAAEIGKQWGGNP